VLGQEYVRRSIKTVDEFNAEFVDFLHGYCWGYVWTRKGLPRRVRSMLNLAMLSTLGRTHELKLHIRGALRNGVSKPEIKEVFLQVAVYAGVPAAVEAFRAAREVFAEAEAEASGKPRAKALAMRAGAKKAAKKAPAKKKPAAKKAAAKKPAAKKAPAKKAAAKKPARKPAAKKAAALAMRAAAKKAPAKKAAAKKPAAKKAPAKKAAKKPAKKAAKK